MRKMELVEEIHKNLVIGVLRQIPQGGSLTDVGQRLDIIKKVKDCTGSLLLSQKEYNFLEKTWSNFRFTFADDSLPVINEIITSAEKVEGKTIIFVTMSRPIGSFPKSDEQPYT